MEKRNVFCVSCFLCLFFLLIVICIVDSNNFKGTNASGECGSKYSVDYSGSTYCCPNKKDEIVAYGGNYYCFNKSNNINFVLGTCVTSISITSVQDSLTYTSGTSYTSSLCRSKLGSGWYYNGSALCGSAMGAINKCTCHANANACTTVATKPPQTLTLTFNANKGKVSSSTQTCETTGSSCSIPSSKFPTATRSGYEFNGWETTSGCPDGIGQLTGSITLSGNKTVYACWKKTNTLTLKVGSSVYYTKSCIQYGDSTSCNIPGSQLPASPNPDNYGLKDVKFTGWGTSDGCKKGINYEQMSLSYDAERYACWGNDSEDVVEKTGKCFNCSSGQRYRWVDDGVNPDSNQCNQLSDISDSSTCLAKNENNIGNTCGLTDYGKWTKSSCTSKYEPGYCHVWNSTDNCCSRTVGSCNYENNDNTDDNSDENNNNTDDNVSNDNSGESNNNTDDNVSDDNSDENNNNTDDNVSDDNSDENNNNTDDNVSDDNSGENNNNTDDNVSNDNSDDNVSDNNSDENGNVTENQETGEIAIFMVIVIAFISIIYSIYYFKVFKENI